MTFFTCTDALPPAETLCADDCEHHHDQQDPTCLSRQKQNYETKPTLGGIENMGKINLLNLVPREWGDFADLVRWCPAGNPANGLQTQLFQTEPFFLGLCDPTKDLSSSCAISDTFASGRPLPHSQFRILNCPLPQAVVAEFAVEGSGADAEGFGGAFTIAAKHAQGVHDVQLLHVGHGHARQIRRTGRDDVGRGLQ